MCSLIGSSLDRYDLIMPITILSKLELSLGLKSHLFDILTYLDSHRLSTYIIVGLIGESINVGNSGTNSEFKVSSQSEKLVLLMYFLALGLGTCFGLEMFFVV